jgi:hypothetical protein
MALSRYIITATTTVLAGAAATPTAGEPGTGAPAGPGNAATTGGPLWPQTFVSGTPIVLDSASPLYTYPNGQGALRPYQQGTGDVSHAYPRGLQVTGISRDPGTYGNLAVGHI